MRLAKPLLLGVLLVLGGCASAGSPFDGEGGESRSIQVRIQNQNFSDATVYALRMGQRIRMGNVMGNNSETFTVRWPTPENFSMLIQLLGGGSCVTRPIPVSPGDRLNLDIAPNLATMPECIR